MTEDEIADREYERAEVAEQYAVCYAIYQRSTDAYWQTTNDPNAGSRIKRELSTLEMRKQMAENNCWSILRRLGWEW